MEWNGGKDVRFQYISFGESVAIRKVAVPLIPFAELEADILGMCVEKVSWTVNRPLYILSTAFVPKRVSCLLVLENERRRRHRLDADGHRSDGVVGGQTVYNGR